MEETHVAQDLWRADFVPKGKKKKVRNKQHAYDGRIGLTKLIHSTLGGLTMELGFG
jgi:hypothetical protein